MYTKIDEGCHLGLCGCSYATDFDSYNYGTYDESTMTNDDLWCNRFTGQASLDNFSRGGSSNYDIYMQIKKALEYNCNYILVFWTNNSISIWTAILNNFCYCSLEIIIRI